MPFAKTKADAAIEPRLIAAGWTRRSDQHYGKTVADVEVAIDNHIGHYCVGSYRENRAIGENAKATTLLARTPKPRPWLRQK